MWWLIVLLPTAYFFYIKLSRGVNRSSACLIGKTAIITGANSGLGFQTTLNLASRGCKVIMADVTDMEESKQNIIKYTNNLNIHTEYLDLSSLKSVRQFAHKILQREEKLDILINNAGIGISSENRTEDGLHPVMQINFFGHFLLTHLLIELLKKSAPSRIVWTSSCMAFTNNLTVQNVNLNNEDYYNPFDKLFGYSNSKLAMLIASDIFAEKLKGTGITSNSLHPGFVRTLIFTRSYLLLNNIFSSLLWLYNLIYGKDVWEGSQTLVNVAVSKKLETVTGKYFWDCKPFVKPFKAYDQKYCQEIWKAAEKYVNLKPEEQLR